MLPMIINGPPKLLSYPKAKMVYKEVVRSTLHVWHDEISEFSWDFSLRPSSLEEKSFLILVRRGCGIPKPSASWDAPRDPYKLSYYIRRRG